MRRRRAEIVQARAKQVNPIKKEIEKLESIIIELESDLEEKNNRMAELEYGTPAAQDLFQKIGEVQMKIATSYQKLDELIGRQDKALASFESQLAELD